MVSDTERPIERRLTRPNDLPGEDLVNQPRCVALTGADTFFGRRLVERWARAEGDLRVVCLDAISANDPRTRTQSPANGSIRGSVVERLVEVLRDEEVESLVHLDLKEIPASDHARHYAEEFAATEALLQACGEVGVGRLVIPSSTMCYGARLENPQSLTEDAALHGHPDAPWVSHRVRIERRVAQFRDAHPSCEVTVLRHCWVMGPEIRDAIVRYFEAEWVPTLLGSDPLLQFVHEEDVLDVLEAAALASHPGVFNLVGEGVLPLSGYLRLADKWNIPTPKALLDFVSGSPLPLSRSMGEQGFSDYLKYIWVASGKRAAAEFGPRTYSSREAWTAMVSARRLHQYQGRSRLP